MREEILPYPGNDMGNGRRITKEDVIEELRTIACSLSVDGHTRNLRGLSDKGRRLYDMADVVMLNLTDKEDHPTPTGNITNADAIRHMTDEELVAEISRLQDIAAACPDCHRKTGVERLRLYLSTRANR